jgi:hypothetical protein
MYKFHLRDGVEKIRVHWPTKSPSLPACKDLNEQFRIVEDAYVVVEEQKLLVLAPIKAKKVTARLFWKTDRLNWFEITHECQMLTKWSSCTLFNSAT